MQPSSSVWSVNASKRTHVVAPLWVYFWQDLAVPPTSWKDKQKKRIILKEENEIFQQFWSICRKKVTFSELSFSRTTIVRSWRCIKQTLTITHATWNGERIGEAHRPEPLYGKWRHFFNLLLLPTATLPPPIPYVKNVSELISGTPSSLQFFHRS